MARALEELSLELDRLTDYDQEMAHYHADDLLLEALRVLGGDVVADAFVRARDRVGFWYA